MTDNNPLPPIVPGDADDGTDRDVDPTREVDGEEVLDHDLDDDLVDSAEADEIAATGEADRR